MFILDNLWQSLHRLPFSDEETEAAASRVYDYVWQRSASGVTWARRTLGIRPRSSPARRTLAYDRASAAVFLPYP